MTTSGRGQGQEVSTSLWTYDAGTRLLTSRPSDEHGVVTDFPDANQSRDLYWRLDEEGRVTLRAGGGSGYRPFRQDTERDEQGNVTALRAVYLDALDLVGDVEGQTYALSEFSNEYGVDGQLRDHRPVLNEGANPKSRSFTHDGEGRCEVVEYADGNDGVERRDYDSAGRLSHKYFEGRVQRAGELGLVDSVITYQFDELGRLRSAIEVIDGQDATLAQLALSYEDDGSLVVEEVQPTDDGDGYSRQVWSPGCGEIQALFLRERSQACQADYGAVADFYLL